MRRYINNFDTTQLKCLCTDCLIVGAGIAGLWTALHLPHNRDCIVICKDSFENSNSWLAQGGVAVVLDKKDTFESHIRDTLIAGAGLCDESAVEVLVKEAPANIHEVMECGVSFDRDASGKLHMGREGGHSCRRIIHSGGDATGKAITQGLLEEVKKNASIRLLPHTRLLEILTKNGAVVGALVKNADGMQLVLTTRMVLATGGIGNIYRHTTNPSGAIGDGIAAAVRCGAKTDMMEMVQFHPTTLMNQDNDKDRLFLISEAVRGEGAVLRNGSGVAFMQNVHPLKDLAPRDVVTRGILKEMERTGERCAHLDVTCMTRVFFANRFPTIFQKCESLNIHLTHESIPVRPAQHYFMGGLVTDKNGRTSVPGLWAVGECACTGVHGANRLASNSMLECLVFGRRCAFDVALYEDSMDDGIKIVHCQNGTVVPDKKTCESIEHLRDLMNTSANAVREEKKMLDGLKEIEEMERQWESVIPISDACLDFMSMLLIAHLVLEGAIRRKESVGAHYLI